jgi:hypothetical protein
MENYKDQFKRELSPMSQSKLNKSSQVIIILIIKLEFI